MPVKPRPRLSIPRVWSSRPGYSIGRLRPTFRWAVRADTDVSAREGLHGADAGWRPQADPGARPASQLLGLHAVEFENTLAEERHLEPVEELRSRIGLINENIAVYEFLFKRWKRSLAASMASHAAIPVLPRMRSVISSATKPIDSNTTDCLINRRCGNECRRAR
jgi:hypothetical protein